MGGGRLCAFLPAGLQSVLSIKMNESHYMSKYWQITQISGWWTKVKFGVVSTNARTCMNKAVLLATQTQWIKKVGALKNWGYVTKEPNPFSFWRGFCREWESGLWNQTQIKYTIWMLKYFDIETRLQPNLWTQISKLPHQDLCALPSLVPQWNTF